MRLRMSALHDLLESYRTGSKTEREKGTYFELLIKDFLKNDPTYSPKWLTTKSAPKNGAAEFS